jgi:hypothetical protein
LIHLEAAILGFPAIIRRVTDAFFPADLHERLTVLDSPSDPDKPLFTKH